MSEQDSIEWVIAHRDEALHLIAQSLDADAERITYLGAKALKRDLARQTRILRAAIVGSDALGNDA